MYLITLIKTWLVSEAVSDAGESVRTGPRCHVLPQVKFSPAAKAGDLTLSSQKLCLYFNGHINKVSRAFMTHLGTTGRDLLNLCSVSVPPRGKKVGLYSSACLFVSFFGLLDFSAEKTYLLQRFLCSFVIKQ